MIGSPFMDHGTDRWVIEVPLCPQSHAKQQVFVLHAEIGTDPDVHLVPSAGLVRAAPVRQNLESDGKPAADDQRNSMASSVATWAAMKSDTAHIHPQVSDRPSLVDCSREKRQR